MTAHDHRTDSRGPAELAWVDARRAAHTSGHRLPGAVLPLGQALWRVAAAPIVARTDLPPMDTSAMDGWAVCGGGPWTVVGDVRAGAGPVMALEPGQAVAIATGAGIPVGANAVLRREDGRIDGAVLDLGRADVHLEAGTDIRRAGEECAAGVVLVPDGATLGPIQVGLAAAGGHDEVAVVQRARAVILVLGDELLTDGPARDGRIRDSLGPQLPGWLERFGCTVVDIRPVPDRAAAHVDALEQALAGAEVVVTTGGTAAGPVDFVHRAIAATAGSLVVDGVDCRPGHPMLLAQWGDAAGVQERRWLVGLPGNPHAAIAALMTLGQPLIAALHGTSLPDLARVPVGTHVGDRGTGTRLVPCRFIDGVAWPCDHIGSGMLRGLAVADGLAVATGRRSAGELVGWLPLPTPH